MGGLCSTSQNMSHNVCCGSFSSFTLIPFHRPVFPNAGITNNIMNCNNTRDLTADEYNQLSTSLPAIDKHNPPSIHTPTTTKYHQLRTHTGPPHQTPAMTEGLVGPTTTRGMNIKQHEHRATGDPSATITMTAAAAAKMTMDIMTAVAKMMMGTTTAGMTTKAIFDITTAAVKTMMGKKKVVGNDDGSDDNDEPDEDIIMPCSW